jgi:hypothetical protein
MKVLGRIRKIHSGKLRANSCSPVVTRLSSLPVLLKLCHQLTGSFLGL